jgi:hypothetical protein
MAPMIVPPQRDYTCQPQRGRGKVVEIREGTSSSSDNRDVEPKQQSTKGSNDCALHY